MSDNDKSYEEQHQAILNETQEKLQAELEANKEALSGDLAPFKGVSMEDWAGANARLSQGETIEDIIAGMGIEMPVWDEINAEWNARMSRDTTATIATVYGQAFTGGGQGQFGAAGMATAEAMNTHRGTDVDGDDPISFEDWVKITEHMNAGAAQGIDAQAILSEYGLNPADWGTIGGYWGQKMNANALHYLNDYQTFSAKYKEQFAAGASHTDIDF